MSTSEIVGIVVGVIVGFSMLVGGAAFALRGRMGDRQASMHKSALLPSDRAGGGEAGGGEASGSGVDADRPTDWNDYLAMDDGKVGDWTTKSTKLGGLTQTPTVTGSGPELLYSKGDGASLDSYVEH
jgi:hypothetical protein